MVDNFLSQVFKSLPAPSLVLLADIPKFTIAEVNDAYLDLVQLTRGELVGKGFYDAFPNNPYNRVPPWNNLLEKLVADGLPNQSPVSKYILPPRDGEQTVVKYLHAMNTPVRNEAGEVSHILRTVTDVTEMTLARHTHSPFTSEKFLDETLRIARVGSWEVDVINEVISWSDVVKEIHEVPADYQPHFFTTMDFYRPGEHRDAFMQAMQETIVSGRHFDLELIINTLQGSEKWIRVTGKSEIVEGVCTRIYGVIQDIHEQKMISQELLRSHGQLESLIQTVDGIVWEADVATFEFKFVSDQVRNILGYTPEQWLNDPMFWENHIYPEDREQAVRYCHRETREMRNHTFDYRMLKADGSLVWIKDVVSVIRENGEAVMLRGIMVDITEAKRLESLEHLEKVVLEMNSVKHTPLRSVLEKYVRGVEALFPQSLCSLQAIENSRLRNLASPSLPAAYVSALEGLEMGPNSGSCGTAAFLRRPVVVSDIATDPRWDSYRHLALPHRLLACWSYPVVLGDETVATFAVYYNRVAEPGEDELKVIERVASILKVIFENKQNSELVEDVNERYEYVNMATNDAIYDWDLQTDHIEWGDGFFRVFGDEPSPTRYPLARWAERVHPADREAISESLGIQLADPQQHKWSAEYRFRKNDGDYAQVEEIGYIKRDYLGRAVRMIGVLRDVTDRFRYVSEIEERNHKLQEIAWMQSHVIRAPLARLMGLIDLIRNYPHSDSERNELLDHVLTSAHSLDEIIRDISSKTEEV